MSRNKAVIIGAGALGLGYLTERLAPDYDICLADTGFKAEELKLLKENQEFIDNICGLDGIDPKKVTGNFETAVTDTPEGKETLNQALSEADLILTVTGRKILDKLVPEIAPAINSSGKKNWVLFCENGLEIAKAFRSSFGPQTTLVDTVMSRMCRFTDTSEPEYKTMWPGYNTSLVVEAYNSLPVDKELCGWGPFSDAFTLVSEEEFLTWEDVKLYLHNGMHAFVAYHAYLEGAKFFKDASARVKEKAKEVALNEVIPAIGKTHPTANIEEIKEYGVDLLERFYNPYFKDTIDRGTRGIQEKLAPGERLLGGCEYIRQAGIEPKGYASTIDLAKEILARQKS